MSYEIRSDGEVIFECETQEEFEERLLEIEMADARGDLKHSDLDGSAWMKTHDGDGNLLIKNPAWQQLQDELRQGREAVEKLEQVPVNDNGVLLFVGNVAVVSDDSNEAATKVIIAQTNLRVDGSIGDEDGEVIVCDTETHEPFYVYLNELYPTQETVRLSIKEQRESN